MNIYDKSRNIGASDSEAKIIERLYLDKMLCANSGLHSERAGISYDVWRRMCHE